MNNNKKVSVINDEQVLNPSPLPYKVSFSTKSVFIIIFTVAFSLYVYMIVERRLSQGKFLLDNQMASAKLIPSPLPDLTIHDLSFDRDVLLANEVQGWTLLNLWATWCPPCKEEMPGLELLQQKLKGKLTIVALSVDENSNAVKDFIAINKPSFKVLWDKNHLSSQKFGVDKYPETFLISPDGLLTAQFSGPRNWGSKIAMDYFSALIGQAAANSSPF